MKVFQNCFWNFCIILQRIINSVHGLFPLKWNKSRHSVFVSRSHFYLLHCNYSVISIYSLSFELIKIISHYSIWITYWKVYINDFEYVYLFEYKFFYLLYISHYPYFTAHTMWCLALLSPQVFNIFSFTFYFPVVS